MEHPYQNKFIQDRLGYEVATFRTAQNLPTDGIGGPFPLRLKRLFYAGIETTTRRAQCVRRDRYHCYSCDHTNMRHHTSYIHNIYYHSHIFLNEPSSHPRRGIRNHWSCWTRDQAGTGTARCRSWSGIVGTPWKMPRRRTLDCK